MRVSVPVIFCLVIGQVVLGLLDEQSVKEKRRCLGSNAPTAAKNVDFDWATRVGEWYFPYWGKLDLYRLASEVKSTPISEIQEDELYYDSCLIMKWGEGGGSPVYGFGGKKMDFALVPIDDNIFRFVAPYSKMDGTAYITLSDNKSFIFFLTCWGDDEGSWAVISPTKTLKGETVKTILEHAKSLGFDEKQFSRLRFETCGGDAGRKDEL